MSSILSIFLLVLLLLPLLACFWLLFTVARFVLLQYINPWRESRGKKPYSRRFIFIVSVLFALAFVL